MISNLQQLSDEHHRRQCEISPAARTGYFRKVYSDKTEKGLMECIEDHAEFTNSGMFWRTPNKSSQVKVKAKLIANASINEVLSGIATEKVDRVYGFSSGTNGMSDMSGFITIPIASYIVPVGIALEIKIPGDTQKEDQIEFEQRVRVRSGWYIMVMDFADYLQKIERIRGYYKS